MSVSTVSASGSRSAAPPRWLVVATILVAGLPAFALGRVIWPDPAGSAVPPAALQPIFIGISALESVLFGIGVAFVLFGRRWLPAYGTRLATATYLAIGWSLVSWWPHDNFHRIIHDWSGLAAIEVGFHVTLIVSILVIGAFFVRSLRAAPAQS
jgi:hypothetical protein